MKKLIILIICLVFTSSYSQYSKNSFDTPFSVDYLLETAENNLKQKGYIDLLPKNLRDIYDYWSFDDFDNKAKDLISTATPTSDRFGNSDSAFYFDGKDDYISLSKPFFNGSTNVKEFTYSVWILPSEFPIANRFYSINTKEGYWRTVSLAIDSFGNVGFFASQPPGLYVELLATEDKEYFINGTLYREFDGRLGVNLDEWSNIIVTFSNRQLKIYINGKLNTEKQIGLNSWDFSWPAMGNSTSTNIIGAQKPATGLTAFFKGKIDDFAIWDRALSSEEISVLVAATSPLTQSIPDSYYNEERRY